MHLYCVLCSYIIYNALQCLIYTSTGGYHLKIRDVLAESLNHGFPDHSAQWTTGDCILVFSTPPPCAEIRTNKLT